MIEVILATVGCVTGVMGFVVGSAALIWTIGVARSTHQISYQPFPADPMTLMPESQPDDESNDALPPESADDNLVPEPKADRLLNQKPKMISSFAEIYGEIDD